MKFQSTILSDARGKLNGSVFTKNRFASVMRNKTSPVNPQTQSQMAYRASFGDFARAFRSLNASQIAAWNAFALNQSRSNVFGQLYRPTGLNWFVGLNQNTKFVNSAELYDPPTLRDLPIFDSADAAIEISSVPKDLLFTDLGIDGGTAVPEGFAVAIEFTQPLSRGISYAKNQFRRTTFTSDLLTANFYSVYHAKFGDPAPGTKIFARLTIIDKTTGLASTPIVLSGVVV